jgi:ABC-type transport system involved in multi-copper enzyme maturation permease subunit
MVIENLQITPLAEWLLGAGWRNGWLWQPVGFAVLLAILAGGGAALVITLRRGAGTPGPATSLWTGSVLGALTLLVLAALAMCSTPQTRGVLNNYVGKPLAERLSPMLGKENPPENSVAKDELSEKDKGEANPQPQERDWSSGALYTWLAALTGLLGLIYFVSWLVSVLISGPERGTRQCGRAVLETITDVARISPRRVYAMAWLAWRESIRRRVVAVFVVFVVIILTAALFMKRDSLHPSQLYINVVLNFTIGLTMLFALVLSSLSLPADIREKTLHTVVTKPVRKLEIVLGRVVGFTAVGTVLLGAIGLISYGFTVTSLRHTHKLTSEMLHKEVLPGNRGYILTGDTSESQGHTHHVTINEKGEWTVKMEHDHTHELQIVKKDGETKYILGPPEGQFQARVPVYGKLSFLDERGGPKDKGINVGDEWAYRSFIKGRTSAMAIWTFSNLTKDMFPEEEFPQGIPIEMTIEVFRTNKGNMEKGVAGTLFLENPKTKKRVLLENFSAEKFATDVHMLPFHFSRPGRDGRIEKYDLFNDLVSDKGELSICIQCLEWGQNFGMAQPDLYIRAADGNFEWNFVKAYLGIWMQMVLVLSLGVMFSTFVSGPVAVLGTVFMVIVGVYSGYVVELASGKIVGGGPLESMERVMTQDNMISQLPPGFKTSAIKAMDQATALVMRYFSAVVPEFNECSYGRHLAYGFDVGRDLLARCLVRELAYVLPVILLGFVFLKLRELDQ